MSALITAGIRQTIIPKLRTKSRKLIPIFRGLQKRVAGRYAAAIKAETRRIPLNKVLMGGEWNWRANRYAYATGELIRPSILALEGPHVQFLKQYAACGSPIFEKTVFSQTAYFRNARNSIRLFGAYFPYCLLPEHIEISARRFALQYDKRSVAHLPSEGHSPEGQRISVFTVRESDCYEIDEGNHRVAFAVMNGDESILADVVDQPQYTPLQEMILRVEWQSNTREIYQPLELPETKKNWSLLRNSEDRRNKMMEFLDTHNLTAKRAGKVLDVGSYYGWFVSEFLKRGYDAYGIEHDRTAISVGELVYENVSGRICWDDAGIALRELTERYGISCCLSLMHHYILRNQNGISAKELLHLLDLRTEKVLFFEMGEEHEVWFSQSLAGWNKDTIKKWVLENSSFKRAYELGRDSDSVGVNRGNFSRMLFAFTK